MSHPDDPLPFVDLELTWSREGAGLTAVLRQVADGQWDELARVEGSSFVVPGLHPLVTTTFAAAPVLEDGGLAPERDWEILRTVPLVDAGAPPLPAAVEDLALVQHLDVLRASWAPAADGVTREWEVREGPSAAPWEACRFVGRFPAPHAEWPWWASGALAVRLRAVDRFGRYGPEAAAELDVQALPDHVDGGELDESGGGFAGTKNGVEVTGGELVLEPLPGPLSEWNRPLSEWAGAPLLAHYPVAATYISTTYNAGQLETERLEVGMAATRDATTLPLWRLKSKIIPRRRDADGNYLPLGRRGFWQGHTLAHRPTTPLPVAVDIDTTPDGAGDTWEGWRPYIPGRYTFWRARFRLRIRGDGQRPIAIPTLVVRHRRLNKKAEGQVVLTGTGPEAVAFPVGLFVLAPSVTCTLVAGSTAVRWEISNVTPTGFDLEAFDGVGATVAATLHWDALGP